MKTQRWMLVASVCGGLLAGCMHVQESTQLTYFLHTDYEAFDVQEDPERSVSNYVAYCILPMDKKDDAAAQMIEKVAVVYLNSNGYYRLTQQELLAEPALIPMTFLVGLSYVQSFAY